jgi:hypothetical protein
MIHGGSSAGFALKALQRGRVVDQFGGQKLEGDVPTKATILGTVDDAHATAAKPLEDSVMGYDTADHGWQPPERARFSNLSAAGKYIRVPPWKERKTERPC